MGGLGILLTLATLAIHVVCLLTPLHNEGACAAPVSDLYEPIAL